jgi:hypothetical protein
LVQSLTGFGVPAQVLWAACRAVFPRPWPAVARHERVPETALTKAVTQSARRIATEISKKILCVPATATEVAPFAQGITAVTKTKASLADILAALRECRDLADKADDGNALGAVFKAACRVDEMFFSKAN